MTQESENPGKNELLRAVTQRSADILSLIDERGGLLYNSAATERIAGFTPAELEGRNFFELIHQDDHPAVRRVFAEVLREPGAVHTMQYRQQVKSGGFRWMEAVASNELSNPAVRAIVANCRDITERLEQDERRRQREGELIELKGKESLGALAGGVAHDFNNILAIILSEANLLRLGGDNRESGKAIELAASRASELTRLLLAYAGRGRYELEPTFLGDLVFETQSLMQMSMRPGASLQVDAAESLPAVEIDRTQVRQVLLNLVQNAVEALHGRPGAVRINLRRETLTPQQVEGCVIRSGLAAGPVVCLEVADDGCGMNPETMARIFEPFFSTRRAGRGLGLAAVAGIVRGHRCGISVLTQEHKGTTFKLYFMPSSQLVKPLPLPDTPAPVKKLQGRALIIDDEPMTSRATKRLVEKIGLAADQAWDGEDGLVRFGPRLSEYTVVILDMIMPRLNGAETFERLRQLRPDLPVVMYSGFDDNMANPCLKQPRTSFLAKPFTAQRLVDAIVQVTRP